MTDILSYAEAITYDELYKSMNKCKHNVIWKDSVANYVLHSVKNISSLASDLENDRYIQKQPYIFTITSPKPREILSIRFRDRVYQRSINDNILYPIMTRNLIYDNYACQYGKGNKFARKRMVEQIRRMINKYGTDLYVLQIDIHGFYKNLKHSYVNRLFYKKLDPTTYTRIHDILSTQYDGDTGYCPGSQMVQIAGVCSLNSIDHYIKERLHVECYGRYMDDLLIVTNSCDHAEYCKDVIQDLLADIGLSYNRKKTEVFPISKGINFLGFKFRVTKTGKLIQTPLPSKIKNNKRKYKRMVTRSFPNGKLSLSQIEDSYRDFRNSISEGNSYYAVQNFDAYYLSLWKGTPYAKSEIQFISSLREKAERDKRRKVESC